MAVLIARRLGVGGEKIGRFLQQFSDCFQSDEQNLPFVVASNVP